MRYCAAHEQRVKWSSQESPHMRISENNCRLVSIVNTLHTQNRRRNCRQLSAGGGGGGNGNLVGEKKLFYSNQSTSFSEKRPETNHRQGLNWDGRKGNVRPHFSSTADTHRKWRNQGRRKTQTSGVWVWKGRDNVLNKGRRSVVCMSGHHITPRSSLPALLCFNLPLPHPFGRAWALWVLASKGYLHIPERREFVYKFSHPRGRMRSWWW